MNWTTEDAVYWRWQQTDCNGADTKWLQYKGTVPAGQRDSCLNRTLFQLILTSIQWPRQAGASVVI